MAYEINEPIQLAIGEIQSLKFKVFDVADNELTISSGSWSLVKVGVRQKLDDTGAVVQTGTCAVNNADEDVNGNAFASVSCSLNLNDTDVDVGEHVLVIEVVLDDGQRAKLRQRVVVRDYEKEP